MPNSHEPTLGDILHDALNQKTLLTPGSYFPAHFKSTDGYAIRIVAYDPDTNTYVGIYNTHDGSIYAGRWDQFGRRLLGNNDSTKYNCLVDPHEIYIREWNSLCTTRKDICADIYAQNISKKISGIGAIRSVTGLGLAATKYIFEEILPHYNRSY